MYFTLRLMAVFRLNIHAWIVSSKGTNIVGALIEMQRVPGMPGHSRRGEVGFFLVEFVGEITEAGELVQV